ncbi:rifin [Plasmodium falciparum IGH-CR14]|uniref:Rifin n=1 Tax=Plasmodium falciparum IGH-CR14 TaxID=580059 RepID=A0A0L1I7N7_PLAFA|nr:rifin [Plasmodium falciparum IGH-CR14]
MKIHYINILLFALPLNMLLLSSQVYNQKNHKSTIPLNTTKIPTNRSLCECELYAPSNYDDDPQMREVMEHFDRQTSRRFEEYEERMITQRQKYNEQRDKDIQQIILKDKIEKELTEKLAALQTDISTNDIPTCFCEKSLPDKVEKSCLKCGKNLGGFVPGLGLIGGTAVYAAAVNAATKAGMKAATEGLSSIPGLIKLIGSSGIAKIATPLTFNKAQSLVESIYVVDQKMCVDKALQKEIFCVFKEGGIRKPLWYASRVQCTVAEASEAYVAEFVTKTSPTTFLTNPYIASCIAIMILVAILLVIFLILHYRKKNKMNKKLLYIKLLKE